ncbi:haloalkane dehalogenase [Myxococcota bacterium]|nr:haloalkane dehalogenase [Myxococcota bacterium]
MKILRTPDARFANLPDYPFDPHYTEVPDGDGGTLRIHHLDEGPRDGSIVLCMHGQPTWSYLYRRMIPRLTAAGLRVMAPDLVGYGRSDKPSELKDYTYQAQVDWLTAWLEANDLKNATLVGQDWGGLIGLRLLAEHPERFARAVAANTGLPTPNRVPKAVAQDVREFRAQLATPTLPEMMQALSRPDPAHPGRAFVYWQVYNWNTPDAPVGGIVAGSVAGPSGRSLTAQEVAAYDAPFPEPRYKAAVRAMPSQVPSLPDDPSLPANLRAWEALERFEKPFLCVYTDDDPVSRGGQLAFIERVPGARGQAHRQFDTGGHFLQENRDEDFAHAIIDLVGSP